MANGKQSKIENEEHDIGMNECWNWTGNTKDL